MRTRLGALIGRYAIWGVFALVVVFDLAYRRAFFVGAPLNRLAAYPAAVLFDALLLFVLLRALPRLGRAAKPVFFLLSLLYGFTVIASLGVYRYFNNLPGVFTFSYMLEEPRDFFSMFAGELDAPFLLAVLGFAALSAYAARGQLCAPPRPLAAKWRVAAFAALMALGLTLDKTVGVTSGFATPFSDALFSFEYAALHHLQGQRSYLRLQGRVVMEKSPPVKTPAPMNVLVVFNESVRRKNLSAFGYKRDTMPNLTARFKSWGDRVFTFPNAYSNGTVTTIATASFITGKLTVERLSEMERASASYEEAKRFPDMRAAYISSHNFHPGNFKEFVASPALDLFAYTEKMKWPATWSGGTDDRLVAEEFGQFLRGVKPEEKFFSILHLSNTHYPYISPEGEKPFGTATLTDRYDNSLRYLDSNLERIFSELDASGRGGNTLVILTSDHGEALKNEGGGGGKGHLGRFYRVTANVPFFVVTPEGFAPKGGPVEANLTKNRAAYVQNADIVPTILDALGLSGVERYPGKSLLRPIDRDRMFFIFNGMQKGIDMDYLAAVRGEDFALMGLSNAGEFKAWRLDKDDKPQPLERGFAEEVGKEMGGYPLLDGFRKKLLEM